VTDLGHKRAELRERPLDLAGALRRLKPEKRTQALARRPDRELTFIDHEQHAGLPLLLDTTVYIDVLQNRAPPELEELLRVRQVNHSSVAVSELVHNFGRLDPAHSGTKAILAPIRKVIESIPAHRLSTPSVQAAAEAGIVTGVITRVLRLPKTDRQPFLNDATLFLQALESGSTLLSRNIADMDLIEQLVPRGRVLLYRQL
jgi:predicted nucleic acid-binding protein